MLWVIWMEYGVTTAAFEQWTIFDESSSVKRGTLGATGTNGGQ